MVMEKSWNCTRIVPDLFVFVTTKKSSIDVGVSPGKGGGGGPRMLNREDRLSWKIKKLS